MKKIKYLILFLSALPFTVLGDTGYLAQRQEFNDRLIKDMMTTMMGNPIIAEIGSMVFYACFAIGLFSIFSKLDTKTFVTTFTKWMIKVWFVYAIIQPGRYSGGLFNNKNMLVYVYQEVQNIFKPYESIGDEYKLAYEVQQIVDLQDNIIDASQICNNTDIACWQGFLNGNPPPQPKEEETNDVLSMLTKITTAFQKALTNPGSFLFPILMWIASIIQQFISYFMLLGMGIITAWSLAALTVLAPFALIDGFDSQIKSSFKNVLAVALFNFVAKLIVWISTVIVQAINKATSQTIAKQIASATSADASNPISVLMIGNFGAILLVLIFQIIATAKIPSIARNIVNLSLSQIVNIGEALFGAALGFMNFAAPVAGGAVGGAIGGIANQAASLSRSVLNKNDISKIREQSGWPTGKGNSINPSIINGDSISNVINQSGSGGSSKSSSGSSSNQKSIFKSDKNNKGGQSKQLGDRVADNITQGTTLALKVGGLAGNVTKDMFYAGFGQGDGLGTIKSSLRKGGNFNNVKNATEKSIQYGISGANNVINASSKIMDSSKKYFSQKNQSNSINEYSELNILMNSEKKEFDDDSKKQYLNMIDEISKGSQDTGVFENYMKYNNLFDTSKIKNNDDVLLNDAFKAFESKKKEESESELSKIFKMARNGSIESNNMKKISDLINSGVISKDMLKNIKGISGNSTDEYNSLKSAFSQQSGNGLSENDVFEYVDHQGKKKNTSLKDLNTRIKEMENKESVSLEQLVNKQLDTETRTAFREYEQKHEQGKLTQNDRQEFATLVNNSQNRIVGNNDKLNIVEKIFGKHVNVGHLRKTNDQLKEDQKNINKVINDSLQKGQNIAMAPIEPNNDKNQGYMIFDKGQFMGFMFENEPEQPIINNISDLKKLTNKLNQDLVMTKMQEAERFEKLSSNGSNKLANQKLGNLNVKEFFKKKKDD